MRAVRSLVVAIPAVVVSAAPSVVLAAGRVALVVGNSTHAHIGRLPNPDNHARHTSAALRRLGFEVTTELGADRVELTEALRAFTRQSAGAGGTASKPSAGIDAAVRTMRKAREKCLGCDSWRSLSEHSSFLGRTAKYTHRRVLSTSSRARSPLTVCFGRFTFPAIGERIRKPSPHGKRTVARLSCR